jgi:hypothetical protein
MGVIVKKTAEDPIQLAIEFLAHRMSPNNALYFKGDGMVQHVVNANIPTTQAYQADQLKDAVKRVVKHFWTLNTKVPAKLLKDITLLESLFDDD